METKMENKMETKKQPEEKNHPIQNYSFEATEQLYYQLGKLNLDEWPGAKREVRWLKQDSRVMLDGCRVRVLERNGMHITRYQLHTDQSGDHIVHNTPRSVLHFQPIFTDSKIECKGRVCINVWCEGFHGDHERKHLYCRICTKAVNSEPQKLQHFDGKQHIQVMNVAYRMILASEGKQPIVILPAAALPVVAPSNKPSSTAVAPVAKPSVAASVDSPFNNTLLSTQPTALQIRSCTTQQLERKSALELRNMFIVAIKDEENSTQRNIRHFCKLYRVPHVTFLRWLREPNGKRTDIVKPVLSFLSADTPGFSMKLLDTPEVIELIDKQTMDRKDSENPIMGVFINDGDNSFNATDKANAVVQSGRAHPLIMVTVVVKNTATSNAAGQKWCYFSQPLSDNKNAADFNICALVSIIAERLFARGIRIPIFVISNDKFATELVYTINNIYSKHGIEPCHHLHTNTVQYVVGVMSAIECLSKSSFKDTISGYRSLYDANSSSVVAGYPRLPVELAWTSIKAMDFVYTGITSVKSAILESKTSQTLSQFIDSDIRQDFAAKQVAYWGKNKNSELLLSFAKDPKYRHYPTPMLQLYAYITMSDALTDKQLLEATELINGALAATCDTVPRERSIGFKHRADLDFKCLSKLDFEHELGLFDKHNEMLYNLLLAKFQMPEKPDNLDAKSYLERMTKVSETQISFEELCALAEQTTQVVASPATAIAPSKPTAVAPSNKPSSTAVAPSNKPSSTAVAPSKPTAVAPSKPTAVAPSKPTAVAVTRPATPVVASPVVARPGDICKFYNRGNCRNGDTCRFVHKKMEVTLVSPPSQQCGLVLHPRSPPSSHPLSSQSSSPSQDSPPPSQQCGLVLHPRSPPPPQQSAVSVSPQSSSPSQDSPQKGAVDSKAPSTPPGKSSAICPHYLKGFCVKGDKCGMQHVARDVFEIKELKSLVERMASGEKVPADTNTLVKVTFDRLKELLHSQPMMPLATLGKALPMTATLKLALRVETWLEALRCKYAQMYLDVQIIGEDTNNVIVKSNHITLDFLAISEDFAKMEDETLRGLMNQVYRGTHYTFSNTYGLSGSTYARYRFGHTSPKARDAVVKYLRSEHKRGNNNDTLIQNALQSIDSNSTIADRKTRFANLDKGKTTFNNVITNIVSSGLPPLIETAYKLYNFCATTADIEVALGLKKITTRFYPRDKEMFVKFIDTCGRARLPDEAEKGLEAIRRIDVENLDAFVLTMRAFIMSRNTAGAIRIYQQASSYLQQNRSMLSELAHALAYAVPSNINAVESIIQQIENNTHDTKFYKVLAMVREQVPDDTDRKAWLSSQLSKVVELHSEFSAAAALPNSGESNPWLVAMTNSLLFMYGRVDPDMALCKLREFKNPTRDMVCTVLSFHTNTVTAFDVLNTIDVKTIADVDRVIGVLLAVHFRNLPAERQPDVLSMVQKAVNSEYCLHSVELRDIMSEDWARPVLRYLNGRISRAMACNMVSILTDPLIKQ